METTKDDILKELGHLYMETVTLRQALGDQQSETARMATEVGSLRKRHASLSATAMAQEENLIALNERLMGRAAQRATGLGEGSSEGGAG